MKYVKPNMSVIKFDKQSINTALSYSPGNAESEEGGGNGTIVEDGMFD